MIKLGEILNESNSKFKVGDKFIDVNSKYKDEKFTVTRVDKEGVYDEHGWYRLNKNCKKVTK